MRKEPYTVGSYVHVIKRGTRGSSIVRDDTDRWRFLLMLRHLNDRYKPENWIRQLMDRKMANTLDRPSDWPAPKKLVRILAFCLLDNHFHLLLKEIEEGGISKFMQKLGTSMANHFNEKYKEKGGLFQSAYRGRTIESDEYLRAVSAYIQVKNAFELFPGGTALAMKDFNKAYAWASEYPYSSLGTYAGTLKSPIIEKDILGEIFSAGEYKSFARDFMLGRLAINNEDITLE
ncbi:MAG: transposase [bacterium]|nr:transposase [bacterium]